MIDQLESSIPGHLIIAHMYYYADVQWLYLIWIM